MVFSTIETKIRKWFGCKHNITMRIRIPTIEIITVRDRLAGIDIERMYYIYDWIYHNWKIKHGWISPPCQKLTIRLNKYAEPSI